MENFIISLELKRRRDAGQQEMAQPSWCCEIMWNFIPIFNRVWSFSRINPPFVRGGGAFDSCICDKNNSLEKKKSMCLMAQKAARVCKGLNVIYFSLSVVPGNTKAAEAAGSAYYNPTNPHNIYMPMVHASHHTQSNSTSPRSVSVAMTTLGTHTTANFDLCLSQDQPPPYYPPQNQPDKKNN